MQVFLWRGSSMNLHTYVDFVYDAVHHFKQQNSYEGLDGGFGTHYSLKI